MSQVIQAVFENGVFKPLHAVSIRDHEKVEIKVVSRDDWQIRFGSLLARIREKTAGRTSDEIEEDIRIARNEARETRRGR